MLAPLGKLNRAQWKNISANDFTVEGEGAIRFRTAPLEGGKEKVDIAMKATSPSALGHFLEGTPGECAQYAKQIQCRDRATATLARKVATEVRKSEPRNIAWEFSPKRRRDALCDTQMGNPHRK